MIRSSKKGFHLIKIWSGKSEGKLKGVWRQRHDRRLCDLLKTLLSFGHFTFKIDCIQTLDLEPYSNVCDTSTHVIISLKRVLWSSLHSLGHKYF